MTELQRTIWTSAMPTLVLVNERMQNLTGLTELTVENHAEAISSRRARDLADIEKIVRYIEPLEPFRQDSELLSVVTGVRASSSVSEDDAKSVGETILKDMEAKDIDKYVFRRMEKAVTMAERSSVVIDSERVMVDPALIFQRLAAVASTSGSDLNEVLSFELCSFPPSLFSSFEVMRTADKASLTNALMKIKGLDGPVTLPTSQRVLDGGWLVQKIPWTAGSTYSEVAGSYVDYVTRHFGQAAVVFDSYTDTPTTKNCTQLKRTKGHGLVVSNEFNSLLT